MQKEYKTVYAGGEGEIIEKKSRFIATVRPVESEEEALAFIEEMRKKYWNATHNVFAYAVGEKSELQRFSDDNEPSGTAGMPVLNVLNGEEVKNTAIVVTRYFGGTLLGTGGLVRAYSKSAKSAVDQAEILSAELFLEFEISAGYSDFEKIQREAASFSAVIEHVQYEATVSASFSLRPDVAEKFCFRVSELSAGRVRPIPSGERLILRPVDCKA